MSTKPARDRSSLGWPAVSRARRPLLALGLTSLVAATACVSVQDYGEAPPVIAEPSPSSPEAPPVLGGPEAGPGEGTPRWRWWNPIPTGRTLRAIAPSPEDDTTWAAGDDATVARFDGSSWTTFDPGLGPSARFFAIGVHAKDDVWISGTTDSGSLVVRFDGKAWSKSYPFAGATFELFSHGPGKRLFASAENSVFELDAAGAWTLTDQRDNLFGHAVDIWVAPDGTAWMLTRGAKVLRLPPGASKWVLSTTGAPSFSMGLALGGTGSNLCAFFANGDGTGITYMTYDGTWHVGPSTTIQSVSFADAELSHGARIGCFPDGSGIMTYAGDVVRGTLTDPPRLDTAWDFPGERALASYADGGTIHAVGSLGSFLSRPSTATRWTENGKVLRNDLLALDVGIDGTMMAVDAISVDRDRGGRTLFSQTGAFAPFVGGGLQGPSLPVDVAVVDAADAWVLSRDNAQAGITHYTGKFGLTWFLSAAGSTARKPTAIWAPAKDDVWTTVEGAVLHFDGKGWKTIGTGTTYAAIHGSGSDDVWFAGANGVAHWDGKRLAPVTAIEGSFRGVWASAKGRVWLWGDRAIVFDGTTTVPVVTALHASAEWDVSGIAEAASGEVFVLTKRARGTSLLWFDATRTKLVDTIVSDLELTAIRGRGSRLWAIGAGGACLVFAPTVIH